MVDLILHDSSLLQDKLESVLDLSHQQMEQYQEQPAHAHKIAYQQRLLQEDLVTIRAQISRLSTVCMRVCVCVRVCVCLRDSVAACFYFAQYNVCIVWRNMVELYHNIYEDFFSIVYITQWEMYAKIQTT